MATEKYEIIKRAHIKACKLGVQRVYSHNDMAIMLREIDRVNQEKEEFEKAFDLAMSMITANGVVMEKLNKGTSLLFQALQTIPVVKKIMCDTCEQKDQCGGCKS